MKKEIFDTIKNEMLHLGILFLTFAAILKIVYFKEDLFIILRMDLSLFWLFLLPGYSIMLYWREKLDFTERIIVGIALAAAVIGIFSYYIGLFGLDMKYHAILLPLVMILVATIVNFRKMPAS